jgi:hypothetical protein
MGHFNYPCSTEVDIIPVWIVQEAIFGDYGNGQVYGVFTDKNTAVALRDEKDRRSTGSVDVIQAVLTVTS